MPYIILTEEKPGKFSIYDFDNVFKTIEEAAKHVVSEASGEDLKLLVIAEITPVSKIDLGPIPYKKPKK